MSCPEMYLCPIMLFCIGLWFFLEIKFKERIKRNIKWSGKKTYTRILKFTVYVIELYFSLIYKYLKISLK